MARRTKLILAGIVLAVGAALAWQFRKAGDPGPGAGELTGPFADAARSAGSSPGNPPDKTAQMGQAQPAKSSAARLIGASPVGSADNASTNSTNSQQTQLAPPSDARVPELSAAFPSASGDANRGPVGGELPARPLERGLGFDEESRLRTHKLADGDTLMQLAQRYLGSPDRWRELFDFNRDVLSDPELLPIGAELRIPSAPLRPMAQEPSPPAPPASVAPAGSTTDKPAIRTISQPKVTAADASPAVSAAATGQADSLTKVQGDSAKKTEPAKMQHLPPVAPVGHVLRVAPRTYVVQSGDTLNSIAEKLYGDGAKESLLQAANRNLVANPQALRPGMVLVVPLDGQ